MAEKSAMMLTDEEILIVGGALSGKAAQYRDQRDASTFPTAKATFQRLADEAARLSDRFYAMAYHGDEPAKTRGSREDFHADG